MTVMNVSNLVSIFDSYNRVARLYPAVIALAPLAWTAPAVIPSVSLDLPRGGAALLFAVACLYLLASLARARGKVIEEKLLEAWGGWPTTLFLRHRDKTIDSITKGRYHSALSTLCGGLKLPTDQEELQTPEKADEIYRSATKRLIEARRDPKYKLLHAENASYGFRRNLLALRSFAVPIAAVSAALMVFLLTAAIDPMEAPSGGGYLKVLVEGHSVLLLAFLSSTLYAVTLRMAITPDFVYRAAREYAEALLRTLDTQVTPPRKPHKAPTKTPAD